MSSDLRGHETHLNATGEYVLNLKSLKRWDGVSLVPSL